MLTSSDSHNSMPFLGQQDSLSPLLNEESRCYWLEQSHLIYWQTPFDDIACQVEGGPGQLWFPNGITNICYNAVDRHLDKHADRAAMIYIDVDDHFTTITYRQLHEQVQVMAAILKEFGIGKGDRIAIYLPMIPEAVVAMLACARIGAIHVVIFAGMAENEVALRLKDVTPKLLIAADGGLDGRHQQFYRPILRKSLTKSDANLPVLMIEYLGDDQSEALPNEFPYQPLYDKHQGAQVECEWLTSQSPNHIIYTSGTSGGRPKGVVRDTGGYAVALTASMDPIYDVQDGDVIFTASNVGWALGHSYMVYAPLLNANTTVMMAGGPLQTGSHRWWQLIEKAGITHLLTTPSAIRQIRQAKGVPTASNDLSRLRRVFLAGEPIDVSSANWLREHSDARVIDHYWQTESGWPLLASDGINEGLLPVADRQIRISNDWSRGDRANARVGSLILENTLGPGAMLTLWKNPKLFNQLYWTDMGSHWRYDTHDWATMDDDGRISIKGRTDDVLKIGGQRIATADIEDIVKEHEDIAEAVIIPLENYLLGQVPGLCIVLAAGLGRDHFNSNFRETLRQEIRQRLGRRAVPRKIFLHDVLPKTPSGKIIRSQLVH